MAITCPAVPFGGMAKAPDTTRSQTYRLPTKLLDRIDAFVVSFEKAHGLKTTATEVVTKAIGEYLDRREAEIAKASRK